jgi:hypothetical protein
MNKIKWWAMCYSRDYPKNSHMRVRWAMCYFKTSSSWGEEIMIQGWSSQSAKMGFKLINSQRIHDVPSGILWSHGMVRKLQCALWTYPLYKCVVCLCGVIYHSMGLHAKEDFI